MWGLRGGVLFCKTVVHRVSKKVIECKLNVYINDGALSET